ncbi:MAG: hypothetical protein JSS81_05640 [Acidobacteria bacterium]|nr:hypothetical protein [Acidobacteriota bacterium]
MRTYDVALPIKKPVVFPALCVVCEAKNPDDAIDLSILGADSPSYLTMAVDTALALDVDPKYYGTNTINRIAGVPACRKCASGLKWYHRRLKFGYYTAWIPGLLAVLLLPGPIVLKVVLMIACVIAPGILTLVFPPSFGATFFNGTANFEFRSKTVADEFLRLNSDAVPKADARTKPAAALANPENNK